MVTQVPLGNRFPRMSVTKKTPQEYANHDRWRKFFANIGHDISNDVPSAQHRYSYYMNAAHNQSMFLDSINQFDVIETASKIKAKISQGHDQISCKLMTETMAHITLPLAHIINQILLNWCCT